MSDKPILFSAPMVRALLEGRKTQTRRIIKPRKHASIFNGDWSDSYVLDPGNEDWRKQDISIEAGDRLWVRETWAPLTALTHNDPGTQAIADGGFYRADDGTVDGEISKWKPSIFMPRHASRLTLTVTEVRVERLQDISEEDARAEGCPVTWDGKPYDPPSPEVDSWQGYGRYSYCLLWSKINGPGSWDANPWVAAYTFTVHRGNIDQIGEAA